jgi:hypothetical protein
MSDSRARFFLLGIFMLFSVQVEIGRRSGSVRARFKAVISALAATSE